MSRVRWKLLAGGLALSLGGLAALAGPCNRTDNGKGGEVTRSSVMSDPNQVRSTSEAPTIPSTANSATKTVGKVAADTHATASEVRSEKVPATDSVIIVATPAALEVVPSPAADPPATPARATGNATPVLTEATARPAVPEPPPAMEPQREIPPMTPPRPVTGAKGESTRDPDVPPMPPVLTATGSEPAAVVPAPPPVVTEPAVPTTSEEVSPSGLVVPSPGPRSGPMAAPAPPPPLPAPSAASPPAAAPAVMSPAAVSVPPSPITHPPLSAGTIPPPPAPATVPAAPPAADQPQAVMPAAGKTALHRETAPLPAASAISQRYRILLRVGEGEPAFEVRCGDDLMLKVICEKIDVKSPEQGDGPMTVKASGRVRFVGFGAEGTCEELSFRAGDGTVHLNGQVIVRVKDKLGRVESELSGDSLRYRIDPSSVAGVLRP